jgi:predicted flap endonuclease-1-like 5' DNA nuclease
MQDFIATYGLWLLIALAIVAVLAFLLTGNGEKKDIDAPSAPTITTKPAEPAPPPAVPMAEPAPPPVIEAPKTVAPTGEPDNLLQIKGIGPKVNGILNGLGFSRFEQIAAWSDADLAEIDKHLGNFAGRPTRDQWMDQAAYLAKGDIAGFEAKYGKL